MQDKIVSLFYHICLFIYRNFIIMQCWLPLEDCMCSRVMPCNLWHGMHFWLYMHPKVFLFLFTLCISFPDAVIFQSSFDWQTKICRISSDRTTLESCYGKYLVLKLQLCASLALLSMKKSCGTHSSMQVTCSLLAFL